MAAARAAGGADPAAGSRGRRAESARYEARVNAAGRLEGEVTFDVAVVEPPSSPLAGAITLGNLAVTGCTARTDAGVGAAVVFGQADGTVAVATPEAGEYVARFTAPPPRSTVDGRLHTLPARVAPPEVATTDGAITIDAPGMNRVDDSADTIVTG